jgi:serine/threonine protein kinase
VVQLKAPPPYGLQPIANAANPARRAPLAILVIVLQGQALSSILEGRVGNPAHQRSRHLGPGDKLGKYELIRQIAVGGMAELYLARTTGIEGFEKLVVIKRILPQYVSNASFVDMFLNEARLAATLHHPNVAQVYDIGREHDDYFFAMEYVHGEDLLRIASVANEQGVPISMDAALTLAAGLCAGLHYAHEKVGADGKPLQIVHRDVSPSNVIVSYDGAVKLVDFGIARAATRHTTGSGLKGKISYMSPEQCRSTATLDRRSDIYAVGCVLYELTTGRSPFDGTTDYAIMTQIVNENAQPPSRFVPEYPAALERILLRALARDPAERYPTALQLQGHLEDFAHESRLRVSPLVLGRLMETLFPERLEEWAQAKSQGAFFVEQHVVRTLIEAGKTPDPIDQKLRIERAAAEARRVAQQVVTPGDDDTTAVNSLGEGESTAIGPPPSIGDDTGRGVPEPVPGSGYSEPVAPPPPPRASSPAIPRAATPPGATRAMTPPPPTFVPGMPGAVPIMANSPGTMFPAPHSVPVTMPQPEPTLRVRLPRAPSPTSYVRPGRRRLAPWLALVGALVIAGGVGAVIAMRDTPAETAQAPAAAAAPTTQPPPPPPAPTPPPPQPAPEVAPTPPPPEPPPAPPSPSPVPEPRPAKVAEPVKHPAPVHHAVHAPKPKPEPAKPEPKEQPWNADSPFMPVRTDKH